MITILVSKLFSGLTVEIFIALAALVVSVLTVLQSKKTAQINLFNEFVKEFQVLHDTYEKKWLFHCIKKKGLFFPPEEPKELEKLIPIPNPTKAQVIQEIYQVVKNYGNFFERLSMLYYEKFLVRNLVKEYFHGFLEEACSEELFCKAIQTGSLKNLEKLLGEWDIELKHRYEGPKD